MKAAFLKKDASEWDDIFGKEGVPAVKSSSCKEYANSKHAKDSGLMASIGDIKKPSPFSWIFAHSELTDRVNDYLKLDEITVIDCTNIIAGPTGGSFLARFGMNVIKVDPVETNYCPTITIDMGMKANRGKKSILVDVQKGKHVLEDLIKSAQVILFNSTEASLDRLGFTPKKVKDLNPDIVICRFDAYGGPNNSGRKHNHIGYDNNVQAAVGITTRLGGTEPEEQIELGTIDVQAGFTAVSAVLSALYIKKSKKGVLEARASLCSASMVLQFPWLVGESEPPQNNPGLRGLDKYTCIYDTSDDKQVLLVGKSHDQLIAAYPDFHDVQKSFADIFKSETADYWYQKLNLATIRTLEENREIYGDKGDTLRWKTEINHPVGKPVTIFDSDCAIKFKNMKLKPHTPMDKYGNHTVEVLKNLYSDAEIERMLAERIISTSWSEKYLPETSLCSE